jgi:pimeloyl-ACP methyl ester carboxylesterase
MPKAKANNIEIEYDTFGDSSSKPLLLVMGLGVQMIGWREEFCEKLVDKGFYVIRFDNRDVGLSTKIEEAGVLDVNDIVKAINAQIKGKEVQAPYKIEDMADDAIGLLDALNVDKAHICGAPMGGMIVQEMAIKYPSRVLSLTSIMSTTGRADLPQPKPEAMKLLMTPSPEERDAYIEYSVNLWRVLHGSGFPFDEEEIREMAAKGYDRSFYPQGVNRQLVGILASGSRKDKLASVNVPTQVIHGGDDPLVPLEGGKDTAESIPGAELLIIEGMGHELPPEAWPQIIDAISANADKAKP